ncbi:tetratricopeptide repeat protein [Saccharopolyspora sp. K220]|uniref:tetratricopeptide repeat protein n=1 Tax=Saccharopolyspora soli TaxID=2926618 RepID=UPI001F58330E|nr:tetratricopeptide repeat protein [Saccharopolyspora soli]MCI2420118.1 tetratricopeptide repeat protein [Saccharopolyspora soli]
MSGTSGAARDFDDIDLLRRQGRYVDAQQAVDRALARGDSAELRILRGRVTTAREGPAAALADFERAVELDPDSDAVRARWITALTDVFRYEAALAAADDAAVRFPQSIPVRLARVTTLSSMNRDDEALAQVDAVLDIAPGDLRALRRRIYVLAYLGRADDAVLAAQQASQLIPDEPDLLSALAYARFDQGRCHAALQALDQAIRIDPAHDVAGNRKASYLMYLSRFEEADQVLTETLRHRPQAPQLLAAHARLAYAHDQAELALERIEAAAAMHPNNALIIEWHATFLRWAERYDEADKLLTDALNRQSEQPQLHVELGRLRRAQGREDDSIAAVREAFRIDPYWMARDVEVALLAQAGRLDEAEQVARRELRIFPHDQDLRSQLVEVVARQHGSAEALAECVRLLADAPNDFGLHATRLEFLSGLCRYDEQLAVAEAAQQRFPEVPHLCHEVGEAHFERHDFPSALNWFERALDGAPGNADTLEHWVMSLRLMGRLDEAEAAAREALRRRPRRPELHEELSLVLSARGDQESALSTLHDGLAECGEGWYLRSALIVAYSSQGRYEEALRETETAIRLDPDNAAAGVRRIDLLEELRCSTESAAAELAERFPEDALVQERLGWCDVDQGRYAAAFERFRRCQEIGTRAPAAIRDQVKVLRIQDRYDEAVALLRAEMRQHPDWVLLVVELGRTFARTGRVAEAVEVARRVQRMDPFYTVGYFDEINALCRMGELRDAEAATRSALERFPDDVGFPHQLAQLYAWTNRLEKALAQCDDVLARSPLRLSTVLLKSNVLGKLRRYGEAERLVRGMLQRFAHKRSLKFELGWILLAQKRFPAAEELFQGLLDNSATVDERWESLEALGWLALQRNDIPEAERQFRAALAIRPTADEIRLALASTLLRGGLSSHHDEVERLCAGVLADDAYSAEAHVLSGVLHFRRGNYATAEHHLRTAVDLDPYTGAYVDLAALYSQLGRFDEAEELLGKAVERDFYDVQAHVELGNLCFQRDVDGGEPGEWAGRAAQQFRQATVLEPGNGTAAIGLARAVARSSGDLVSAEEPLRYALDRADCDLPKWRLQVELARLLVQRGDATGSEDLYLEALAIAREAIGSATDEAEPYFVAGVAAYKIGESGDAQLSSLHFRRAMRYLRRVEQFDSRHSEAHRVRVLAQQRIRRARSSVVGSTALITVSLVMLALLWSAFFLQYQVPTVLLGTLTPVLVAMVAVGFLLPLLVRLKLPGGLEADLSASLHQVSSGPTGEVSLGAGRYGGRRAEQARSRPASLSEGPRGELSGRS